VSIFYPGKKMAPFLRADQVGSLIRPKALLEAYGSAEANPENLVAVTEKAITHAVQRQLDLDIRPVTTGEYERVSFFTGFFEKLQGMELRSDLRLPEDFRRELPIIKTLQSFGLKVSSSVVTTGKIKHVAPVFLDGWETLKKTVPEDQWKYCKISIPSLTWEHFRLANGLAFTPEAYSSDREYFIDLAAAYRAELKILYDAGLRSVQIDEPQLMYFIQDDFLEGIRKDGIDPAELMELYIWALNLIVEDRPKDLHVGLHLCRGNMPGAKGFLDGSYEKIAEKLLNGVNYDTFYLEFDDNTRSGNFEPLRFLPMGKNVALGLVSTKTPELENLEELNKRVHEAAQVIATAQGRTAEDVLQDTLAVSPQCGFASTNKANGVGSEERMWEKLVLVRDLARSIWKDAV
jgi:methionine synthase II (cobalamin-independent)